MHIGPYYFRNGVKYARHLVCTCEQDITIFIQCFEKTYIHIYPLCGILQGNQSYMAVCFLYLVKSDLSSVRVYCKRTLDKSFFSRYQKNTAMLIWSDCIIYTNCCKLGNPKNELNGFNVNVCVILLSVQSTSSNSTKSPNSKITAGFLNSETSNDAPSVEFRIKSFGNVDN